MVELSGATVVESIVDSVSVEELLHATKNAEIASANNTFFILNDLVFYNLFYVYTIFDKG